MIDNNESDVWTLARLKELVTGNTDENLHLEFKGAGALKHLKDKLREDISKDVSAMANSDGGVILYGISEKPTQIDPVDRTTFSKQRLEDYIGQISPRLTNYRILEISVSESNLDQVVYAVIIGKSTTAHQATTKLYYKRFETKAEPMLDYEIKDVMNRTRFPKLSGTAKVKVLPGSRGNLSFQLSNVSEVLALHYRVIIDVPAFWKTSPVIFNQKELHSSVRTHTLGFNGVMGTRLAFSNDGKTPLFPYSIQHYNFKFTLLSGERIWLFDSPNNH